MHLRPHAVADAGRSPVSPAEVEEAIEHLDDMAAMLSAAATDRGGDPVTYLALRDRFGDLFGRVGLRTPFRWDSLTVWAEFAKTKFPRDYRGRRQYVDEITGKARNELREVLDGLRSGDLPGEIDELDELAVDTLADPSAILVELRRVRSLLRTDPGAAIGKAKNLVEATAKAVLVMCGQPVIGHSMDKLVNNAMRALGLPAQPTGKSAEAEVARLLKQLAGSVTELRNLVGDGHAPETAVTGVELRHGRLAVRAALAWCAYMLETVRDQGPGPVAG
ncbi:abortive infection family protein [Saccharothrix sp. ALI-22-I]|uniref:abortive infection family protein n=1 Tax=Saccharothrix sp. ALI-22-I TaxID=1933778 RepID=UPI00097C8B95|nr:abortive infection family protein [Saccharothrix sp. ALI-22-I]